LINSNRKHESKDLHDSYCQFLLLFDLRGDFLITAALASQPQEQVFCISKFHIRHPGGRTGVTAKLLITGCDQNIARYGARKELGNIQLDVVSIIEQEKPLVSFACKPL
jgi:hypothetical protein